MIEIFLKKKIPDEEYLTITDYLIKDCLQNSGAVGTIEEKISELHEKKRNLAESIIKPWEALINSLSEEDIKELFGLSD